MSKSHEGTKKTSSFINTDSEKYIDRSSTGQQKCGSKENGTHAAHKFGFGLMNTIETRSSGRPLGEEARVNLVNEMNSNGNLRLKTSYGNQVLDERRDARIAQSYVSGSPIQGKSTAERAYVAYKGASQLTNEKYANEIGDMRVYNSDTGGYYKVKNHEKYRNK